MPSAPSVTTSLWRQWAWQRDEALGTHTARERRPSFPICHKSFQITSRPEHLSRTLVSPALEETIS